MKTLMATFVGLVFIGILSLGGLTLLELGLRLKNKHQASAPTGQVPGSEDGEYTAPIF